jgi:hypothetical protein
MKDLVRPRGYPHSATEALRKRSRRMRSFLTAFGTKHWADRITARRRISRRGRVAL